MLDLSSNLILEQSQEDTEKVEPKTLNSIFKSKESPFGEVEEDCQNSSVSKITEKTKEALNVYLKEIRGFKLLTLKEEEDLNKTMRNNYAEIILMVQNFSSYLPEIEEMHLKFQAWEKKDGKKIPKKRYLKKIKNWLETLNDQLQEIPEASFLIQKIQFLLFEIEEVRRIMINANLKLVVSIAKKFMHQGLPLVDLIQEGNIGLIRAVSRFEFQKGVKFGTYATFAIRQAVYRALMEQSSVIYLPISFLDSRKEVSKTFIKLSQKLDRKPTMEELSKATQLTPKKLDHLLMSSGETLSLSLEVGENEHTLENFLEDTRNKDPFEFMLERQMREKINLALNTLTPRESKIISLRCGIDEEELSLHKVGKQFSLSRERIRQIEAKVLQKLRSEDLHDLLETKKKVDF